MIRVLDKAIADKIAAGEVVERPVSIVKELVENSIDAGANSVTVEIKKGGKSYIRVTDNGCGIHREEAERAFLRHATSKISSVKDLDAIETLGFRGEALASIAAVTMCELITKTADSKTGTRFTIRGGVPVRTEQTGCPNGTTIVITDLFYNTPARLKFMKSDSAESGLIIDFVSQIALAYKDIRFCLINNGKVLFTTQGDGNRLNTIIRIYHDVDAKNMVPVSYSENGLSLEGYISTPAMSKTTRGSQIFFVNGRVVNSKVMEKGVTAGYKERLFEGRYPVAYLFLEVDSGTLDVNIHPNKREVRFDDEALISDFISRGIRQALATKEAVVDAGNLFNGEKGEAYAENIKGNFKENRRDIFSSQNFVENSRRSEVREQVDIKSLLSTLRNNEPVAVKDEAPAAGKEAPATEMPDNLDIAAEPARTEIEIALPAARPFDITEIKVTGVLFDTYITATDEDNFYLIDQHAAQERIFYEKLVAEYDAAEKMRQPLLTPLIINTSLSAAHDKDGWLKALDAMGFTIDEFGPDTYRVPEIPMFMELSEAEDFINNFIENIHTSTDFRNTVVVDKLIMMSCKAAIKAGDRLSAMEVRALINELAKCVNPFSCPHGRPTFIKLTRYEIEKMFKRV